MGRQADLNSISFICVVPHQHAKTRPRHVGNFIKTFKLKKQTNKKNHRRKNVAREKKTHCVQGKMIRLITDC